MGRFTQPDPLIPGLAFSQAWNRFSYTFNNPINFTDPSGHFAQEAPNDEIGPSGISGRQFYDWYLWLYNQSDGWWWGFFGGFTIYDAMAMVLIGEGSFQYNKGELSAELFAEAGIRDLYSKCRHANNGSCSTEQFINQFASYMGSAGTRIKNGFSHDPNPESYRNFGNYETQWALDMSDYYSNPDPAWTEGCLTDRPCGFGNKVKGNDSWSVNVALRLLATNPELAIHVFYLNDGFLITDKYLYDLAHGD